VSAIATVAEVHPKFKEIPDGARGEAEVLTDMRLVMPNRPGALISALQAIADAGINIRGSAGDLRPGEQWGYIHILVDDFEAAQKAIEAVGFEVTSLHDVDVLKLEDHPGAILEAAEPYSAGGQNIEVFYMSRESLVVGTDAMRKPIPGTRVEDARYR
jgi:hypothetical protein